MQNFLLSMDGDIDVKYFSSVTLLTLSTFTIFRDIFLKKNILCSFHFCFDFKCPNIQSNIFSVNQSKYVNTFWARNVEHPARTCQSDLTSNENAWFAREQESQRAVTKQFFIIFITKPSRTLQQYIFSINLNRSSDTGVLIFFFHFARVAQYISEFAQFTRSRFTFHTR